MTLFATVLAVGVLTLMSIIFQIDQVRLFLFCLCFMFLPYKYRTFLLPDTARYAGSHKFKTYKISTVVLTQI